MITDWVTLTRIRVVGADRLYPKGIDWKVQPGVNAVVGGTGLGKTTLIYAAQYAVFGKLVVERDRIEREFFADRMSKQKDGEVAATVAVEFTAGGLKFAIERNLKTGGVVAASIGGEPVDANHYEKALARAVGLAADPSGLTRVQQSLLFFGEGRYLLAWDNQIQNQLITLMMSDQKVAARLDDLWENVKSSDSEARNLSSQAFRLEQDIERIKAEKPTAELRRRRATRDIGREKEIAAAELVAIRKQLKEDSESESQLDVRVSTAYHNFNRQIVELEETEMSAVGQSVPGRSIQNVPPLRADCAQCGEAAALRRERPHSEPSTIDPSPSCPRMVAPTHRAGARHPSQDGRRLYRRAKTAHFDRRVGSG